MASTCSTSLDPMPKPRAPRAPWVAVCESPHTSREAGLGQALLGPDDVHDAHARVPRPEQRQLLLAREADQHLHHAADLRVGLPFRSRPVLCQDEMRHRPLEISVGEGEEEEEA